jgi:hypothetical protein
VQRGKEAAILLNGKADGKLFAMCRIKEGAVDKVHSSVYVQHHSSALLHLLVSIIAFNSASSQSVVSIYVLIADDCAATAL